MGKRIKALRNALRRGRMVQVLRCARQVQASGAGAGDEGQALLQFADWFLHRCQHQGRRTGLQHDLMKPRKVRGSKWTPKADTDGRPPSTPTREGGRGRQRRQTTATGDDGRCGPLISRAKADGAELCGPRHA